MWWFILCYILSLNVSPWRSSLGIVDVYNVFNSHVFVSDELFGLYWPEVSNLAPVGQASVLSISVKSCCNCHYTRWCIACARALTSPVVMSQGTGFVHARRPILWKQRNDDGTEHHLHATMKHDFVHARRPIVWKQRNNDETEHHLHTTLK